MEHFDWPQLLAILGTAVTTFCGAFWYAVKTVGLWIKPWCEKLFSSWLLLIEKLTTQHNVLEQFAASLSVLTQMASNQQVLLNRGHHIILTVDDNALDRKIISTAVFSVMSENDNWRSLTYKEVDKLYLAYEFHPFSRLIILDYCLPDATNEQVMAFLQFSKHCRVIVYTATDNETFPGAFAVIKKGSSINELKDKIREGLTL